MSKNTQVFKQMSKGIINLINKTGKADPPENNM